MYNAEQVAIWVLQDYKVGTFSITPGISSRTYRNQPLYLTVFIARVEIQVQPTSLSCSPISSLKGQVRPSSFRISKDNPPAAGGFSGSVVKRRLPELHHSLEFVAMYDD